MANVTVYFKSWCPYCRRAMNLLQEKGAEFEAIDVDGDTDLEDAMIRRSGGRTTVPQIFIDDRHVGGCDDLYASDDAGELDRLLDV